MTAPEASKLANEYRRCSSLRALEILQILRENGWASLARLLESE